MSGYVPLFDSLTKGTLCGKWPDVGLWAIVLSLSDRHGIVDVTPDYLARVTGLPVDDVTACMTRFCEPDPNSRSTAEGGARLTLLDPNRSWGWWVVNHGKYREKARLQAKDASRTASGEDADRKRHQRETSPDVPRRPPESHMSPRLPLSDSDSDSKKQIRPQESKSELSAEPFHRELLDCYHEVLPYLPRVKVWTKKRAGALAARIRERCRDGKPADSIGYWRKFFEQVAASDFLSGRAGDWRADLEWLITSGNFTKVIEGKYENRNRSNGANHAR